MSGHFSCQDLSVPSKGDLASTSRNAMADNSQLLPYVDRLKTARVLCIGDVMLDHSIYGQVEQGSPEAPIPVLCVEREMKRVITHTMRVATALKSKRSRSKTSQTTA